MYQDSCEENLIQASWNSAAPSTSYQQIVASGYQVPQMSQLNQMSQQPIQSRYQQILPSSQSQNPPTQLHFQSQYQPTQLHCQPQNQSSSHCQPQYPPTQPQPQYHTPESVQCHSPSLATPQQLDWDSQATYQASYHMSSDRSCQLPHQTQLQVLYSRQWGQDLYALTEEALHEVAITDHNCPVCQWDHHLTRHRSSREPPHPTGSPSLPSGETHRPAVPDTVGKILISSNSGQAAIYMNVKFVPNAKESTATTGSVARDINRGGSRNGGIAESGSLMAAPQLSETDYRKLERLSKRLAKSFSTPVSATPSWRMPSASFSTNRDSNRPAPDGRLSLSDTGEHSEEGTPKAPSVPAPVLAPEAATTTALVPVPAPALVRDVNDSDFNESTNPDTPVPLETISGKSATSTSMPPPSGGEGEWFTSTLATGSQGKPYKTTIQLLRFIDRDSKVKPVPVPKRLLPPMFLSRHQPENVVSGKNRRRLPAVVDLQPSNYSNSMKTTVGVVQDDPMEHQKQVVTNAIRLTRLFENSWGRM